MVVWPMFVTGLATSFHCVAMCGTMVATYAIRDGATRRGMWARLAPHLAYQGAKILSYVAVGLVLGAVGAALDLGGIRGYVTVAAGLFMVALGLGMTGYFPWLRYLTPRPPKALTRALSSIRVKANEEAAAGHEHIATPITFGLLTGLMPCGPLQAAQLYAAGTGSPLTGALAMFAFGLGTAPLMLGFGALAGSLSGIVRRRMLAAAAIVVVVLGLVMLDRGAMLLGSPVNARAIAAAIRGDGASGAPAVQLETDADGVAIVRLAIENTRFVPDVVNIPADRPVRLVVDRRENAPCSNEVAIPQLGIRAPVAPFAVTTIELPPAKAGTYTLTCGMGMMSGRVVSGGGAVGVPAK